MIGRCRSNGGRAVYLVMRSKLFFLFAAITMLLLQSCSSRKVNRGEQVIDWINEGQNDSLRANLHADFSFELRDAPSDKFKNADFFLGEFMQNQKFLEGKYKINKLEYESGAEDGHPIDIYQIHATYNNIYQKYLGIGPNERLIKMEFYEGKMVFMSTGSTDKDQSRAFMEKLQEFESWMKKNHPGEDLSQLMKKQDKLFVERMKEFKKDN